MYIRLILWFCLWWGFGAMLHIGFIKNPKQRKFSASSLLTRLFKLSSANGELAVAPALFQVNTLIFLIFGVTELLVTGSKYPTWSSRIWLGGVLTCAALVSLLRKRD